MDTGLQEKVRKLRERVGTAKRMTILTGAGISAESGVPTFRGKDGLWREYRVTDLATPEAFAADPDLVWEFYNWRRELLEPLQPNPAHRALVKMEERVPEFTLITQNIDGLHHLAGSRRVLEMHGNIWKVRCTRCATVTEDRRVPMPSRPACETCGGPLRPHVVWFGEALEEAVLNACVDASARAEVMLVIGTSGVVYPAAGLGGLAKQHGAYVAEINLDPTPSGVADVNLTGKAGEIVPLLVDGG